MSRITFLRFPGVKARRGKGKSTTYKEIQEGTFPPPIKIGPRASGWPEHEVDAVNRAYMAGKSADDIKLLVSELVAARRKA